jgi:hypothetical protein
LKRILWTIFNYIKEGRRKREEGRRKREEGMNHKGTEAQRKKEDS